MAPTAEEGVNNEINDDSVNNNNNNISHESEDNSNCDAINNNHIDDNDMEKTSSTNRSAIDLNRSETSTTDAQEIKKDVKLFFVEVQTIGSNGRQPENMQMAFTTMKSFKFTPNWMKEEEVLSQEWAEDTENLLFVLYEFDDKVFEHLWSKQLRIISPLTILYCYSKECPKPYRTIPVKSFPVFSQCMRKLFISISGFEGQKKKNMISKITRMCGNYCKDFTKSVTYLVTDSVRTKKYKVAKEKGVTVVSSQWIDECWSQHQHNLKIASDKEIVDKYLLKAFNKLLITVSQVDVEERKRIENIVNENGGQYSPSLKLNETNSVLLLRKPEGEKFKYAHLKGVPCLNVQWLYDSHEKGYALPEEDYAIHPSSQRSQNATQKLSENRPKPSNGDQIDSISFTHLSQSGDKTSTDKISENGNQLSDKSSQEIIDRINTLFKEKKSDETFLEGCDIFIVGFKRPVFDVIKPVLISCGSMVYNEFKNIITHVIVGPNCVDTELEQFFDNKSCKLVSIEWLFECIERNECCDCSPFQLKNTKLSQKNSQKRNKPKALFDGPLTVVCPKATHKALAKWKEDSKIDPKLNHKSLGEKLNDKNDIQWNDEEVEDMPSQKPYGEDVNENSHHNNHSNDSRVVSESEDKRSEEKLDDKTEEIEVLDVESDEQNDVIPKKVFLFSGYDETVKNDLKEIVEQLNGTVIDSYKVLDNITHLVIRDPSATEKTLSAIASGIWVMKEDYLYESKAKGEFVSEEQFEWGFSLRNDSEKSIRKRLMVSAVKWRKHLKEMSEEEGRRRKAFDDWDVLFLFPTRMTQPYAQVFSSANANIIQLIPDFDTNRLNDIKYAFVDHKSVDDIPKHVIKIGRILTKMDKLFKIDFISQYLLNGPEADLRSIIRKTRITDRFWDQIRDTQKNLKRVRDDSIDEATHSAAKQRK